MMRMGDAAGEQASKRGGRIDGRLEAAPGFSTERPGASGVMVHLIAFPQAVWE